MSQHLTQQKVQIPMMVLVSAVVNGCTDESAFNTTEVQIPMMVLVLQ